MPYPEHIEEKIEFNHIRNLIKQQCISSLGESYVNKINFISKFDLLQKILQQTDEFKQLLVTDQPFPSEHYYPIDGYIKRASIQGTFLIEHEWHQIRLMLRTFNLICKYFEERNEKYPQLFQLFGGVSINETLIKLIEKIINEEGDLRTNASAELSKISSKIADKEKEIRKRIHQLYEKAVSNGWLAESGITVREGRLVLPVLAEFKRNIQGFIHDESATGQTIFIEPTEAFDLNNILRELQIAFKRERERVLIELTDKIRPDLPDISRYMLRMGMADFIRAKALLAIKLNAQLPILKKYPVIQLRNSFHPLLKLHHQKLGIGVVPLDIDLNIDKKIVVISGPNAGGKSVCLKTIGLLQYMLQCGLLIPCDSHSEMGIFNDMLVDIGDEQSIENDLSTYSSHLKHMKYFTQFADNKTIFLIDEFGTGTDPMFGGPLAESILNALKQKGAYGVVTTHYSNLKTYASNTKGIENACMLFDNSELKPLYKLEMGKPGSSYAFEIARKTGLSEAVLNYAKNKVGDKQKRLDDLLIELEREKKHVNDLKERYEKKDAEANLHFTEYTELSRELESQKKKIITLAKQEALSIISEANSRIENTIREIKEKKADTETIKHVRKEIKDVVEQLQIDVDKTHVAKFNQRSHTLQNDNIVAGSWVTIQGHTESGQVLEVKKNKANIAFDNLHTWIDTSRLTVVTEPKTQKNTKTSGGLDMNVKLKNFQTELNLIGTRGEDATRQLQIFIDDAYLLGFKQVRIVHGKGYGILRKLVREWLKQSSLVEYVQDEHIESGGDGVSIVNIKL
jgi:DNA mismatch repair protein MutS2